MDELNSIMLGGDAFITKPYNKSGALYGVRFSTLQTNSAIANNFILQTGMIYGAVVLMVICLTVLSLQQLLDAGQYKYRFSVLRKLGVEEHPINKLILKQLSVWFGLPIIAAIIVAAVVIGYFIQTISAEISAYIGLTALMLQIGATVGILVILLFCYFISTWLDAISLYSTCWLLKKYHIAKADGQFDLILSLPYIPLSWVSAQSFLTSRLFRCVSESTAVCTFVGLDLCSIHRRKSPFHFKIHLMSMFFHI